MKTSRRATIMSAAALACALALATELPAAAAEPVRLQSDLDVHELSAFLTDACGTPVYVDAHGSVVLTIHVRDSGAAREIDTFPGFQTTLSAPATGGSATFPSGPSTTDYPQGVYPGAPATVTVVGLHQNLPGFPADAGQTVFEGIVVFVTPEGIPVVDTPEPPVKETGDIVDPDTGLAHICASLTG